MQSPAFLTNPWESLKVNAKRGLLAGVSGFAIEGAAFFDVYDIHNCTRPTMLNSVSASGLSVPANALGHEGNFSPDGKTYWTSGGVGGSVVAIGLEDPYRPVVVWAGNMGIINHGLALSPDGRTLYMATIQPEGLSIYDVASIQERALVPQATLISSLTWSDGANGQQPIPVTWKGRPYIVFVDEQGSGGVRIIDIKDRTKPKIVRKLKLEIQRPENADAAAADTEGTGFFGYESHYCSVDRATDPTRLACGWFQSGVRVFDIVDPLRPKELAYFNPPAQDGNASALPGSEHAQGATGRLTQGDAPKLTADWCSSPPTFVGADQLWVSCQDNGYLVLRFTNGAR